MDVRAQIVDEILFGFASDHGHKVTTMEMEEHLSWYSKCIL